MIKKIAGVLFLLFAFALFSEEFETDPRLHRGTLPNGLRYFILKNKKPEKKAILNLVVKAGSIEEEDGDEGIAHIIEHMAFNGTKKYKKNDMIRYLQSIGLSFGGDLNAYTSFDETVYKLLLPTDDKAKFEKGVEILREWANEVTLRKADLESEKKIILEEWRLQQGLTQRLGDIRKKALLDNTRYYDRFPIGTVESIGKATPERLRLFYDTWYNPANMAVIAIGDLDIPRTEALIKKYFSYQPRQEYKKPPVYPIHKIKDKYVVFKDPELLATVLYITRIVEGEVINTPERYRQNNIKSLLYGILNTRISNLLTEKDTPLLEGAFYSNNFNITHDMITLGIVIKEDRTKDGIELGCRILKATAEKGITQVELDLEKKNMLNSFKNLLTNKDSISHERIAQEILRHYLTGESYIGIEKEFEVFSANMESITVEDLNAYARELFSEESLYFISASDKNTTIPDEAELKTIVTGAAQKESDLDFAAKEVVLPPAVIKEGGAEKTKAGGWILSNGIRVMAKKTDFDKDRIMLRLFKKEGSSNLSYTGFLNALFAPAIISNSGVANLAPKDIESFMKGKNISLSPYIDDYEQGIEIVCDQEGLIPVLEYMTYQLREPKVDPAIFQNILSEVAENIRNRHNSPSVLYRDELTRIYSGGHERRLPLTLEELKKISPEELLRVFREQFDNFNGFDLVIVGSYDEGSLEGILKKYFASLPGGEPVEGVKELNLNIPKGIETKTLVKGIDKKATVTLIFPYNYKYGENERLLFAAFSRLLNMDLNDEIREKLGGVYAISSYVALSPNNYGENRLMIQFSCEPKRVEEIKKATVNVLKKLRGGSRIPNYKMESIYNNFNLSYRNDILRNAYWMNYYYQKFTVGDSFNIPTPAEYKKRVTGARILDLAKKAVNLNNYIDVTLLPEKEE
ncbi:MAG: insulinase family protein [Fusobacteriaceae bacterium]|jgi:zinc protease|nr:insulinase family protein [Fusobacteriaceae bacterium]